MQSLRFIVCAGVFLPGFIVASTATAEPATRRAEVGRAVYQELVDAWQSAARADEGGTKMAYGLRWDALHNRLGQLGDGAFDSLCDFAEVGGIDVDSEVGRPVLTFLEKRLIGSGDHVGLTNLMAVACVGEVDGMYLEEAMARKDLAMLTCLFDAYDRAIKEKRHGNAGVLMLALRRGFGTYSEDGGDAVFERRAAAWFTRHRTEVVVNEHYKQPPTISAPSPDLDREVETVPGVVVLKGGAGKGQRQRPLPLRTPDDRRLKQPGAEAPVRLARGDYLAAPLAGRGIAEKRPASGAAKRRRVGGAYRPK